VVQEVVLKGEPLGNVMVGGSACIAALGAVVEHDVLLVNLPLGSHLLGPQQIDKENIVSYNFSDRYCFARGTTSRYITRRSSFGDDLLDHRLFRDIAAATASPCSSDKARVQQPPALPAGADKTQQRNLSRG
jgi:hypothetical protein